MARNLTQMDTALRFYPNTNVADGYAIVSLDDGRQHNVRVSRRLRPGIDDLSCALGAITPRSASSRG